MKKYTPAQLLSLLGMPALTVILGLVLLLSPDTASALVGKVLGWACILAALAFAFGAASGSGKHITGAIVCGVIGVWMLMNPLFLARILGRVLGLFLLLRGIQSIRGNWTPYGGGLRLNPGLVIGGAVCLVGLVLILVPLATSRLVFSLIGIVMIGVGVAQGYDRLRGRRELEAGSDPDIIDVEKV